MARRTIHFDRPDLFATGQDPTVRPAREIAPGPDPYFCGFCGVATWTPYSRRPPGFRQWLKPVWTACEDAECRARVDGAAEGAADAGRAAA